jgi:glycosyltransferase involved in cell wall biosynthesis
MSRIIVLTGDVITEKIAGPAVRALEIAQALSSRQEVTLGCPRLTHSLHDTPFEIMEYGDMITHRFLEPFDAAFAPGSLLLPRSLPIPLIMDLYDPFILSNLHRFLVTESMDINRYEAEFEILVDNILNADYFVCASERQRDLWLGVLTAFRRVNRISYSLDQNLRSLIDLLPFGIRPDPPAHVKDSPFPGSQPGDKWIIWAGGIWNWFDPLTLLHAMKLLVPDHPQLKLYFMGTKHPDPMIAEMKRARETETLARELELEGKHVFFGDWIPYETRGKYLAASWIGISTHHPHLETRFSFRTRILDYIWARLPIICTGGDSIADLVQSKQLGMTVPPDNSKMLADALRHVLEEPGLHEKYRSNLAEIAPEFEWQNVVKPLQQFCDHPKIAPDKSLARELFSAKTEVLAAGCEDFSEPVGEIIKNHAVEQFFVCRFNGLCRIDLKLATYTRINRGMSFISLEDPTDHTILVKCPINMTQIDDNEWHPFRFEPLFDSKGKTYLLRLESESAVSGNAITVWSNAGGGTGYYYAQQKREGSITFRAFCQSLPAEAKLTHIWRRMFKRRFF